jgi:Fe-S-cluster containining protein
MDLVSFTAAYCRIVESSQGSCLCLIEKEGYDCVFLASGTCGVYAYRPTQCRTYPFWEEIVETEEAWKRESEYCPGIGSGELRKPEEIAECLLEQRGFRPFEQPGVIAKADQR